MCKGYSVSYTHLDVYKRQSLSKFVANIKDALAAGDMKKAQEICDKQRGSVAVSYTHLDVYKRQILNRAKKSS